MKDHIGTRASGGSGEAPAPFPFHVSGRDGGSDPDAAGDRPAIGSQRDWQRSGPRILLVSYHFPPGQSVGALRWQQIAGFAAERGWELDVVTLHPDDLDAGDPTRLDLLPDGTRVWGVREPTLWPERMEKWIWRIHQRISDSRPSADASNAGSGSLRVEELSWRPRSLRDLYRAYNAWRDHARGGAWADEAGDLAEEIFDPAVHRVVVTCGPPHMEHLAGRRLRRAHGVPWVMDMRDAWSCMPRLQQDTASLVWPTLARLYEGRCVREADLVVVNTEPAREALAETHPAAADRMITVMNGFDADAPPMPPDDDGAFRLAFAGSLYLDRDPRPLFDALYRVVSGMGLTPDHIRLEMMGHVRSYGGQSVRAMAREAGVEDFVRLHEPRPREEALRFLAGANVLLSLPQDLKVAIPSKIFEYMQFPGWIVVAARTGSAAERVLRGTGADVVEPGDVEAMARVLAARYRSHAAGERPRPLAEDHPSLSRRAQANRLLDALETWSSPGESPRGVSGAVRVRGGPRSPPRPPALMPKTSEVPTLVVTVDTEEDDWEPSPGVSTARNIREIPRLQELFEEHGIRPTYLVTYQVASDTWAAEYLGELHRSKRAEIGCHLHPWNTPPLTEEFSREKTLLRNLDPSMQEAKLRSLIDRVSERVGVTPTSFRTGRWGISPAGLSAAARAGIRTDSSVLPYRGWLLEGEAVGFGNVPSRPYRLNPDLGLERPARDGPLVEVPPTVGFTRSPWERWAPLDRIARWRPLRPLHLPGLLARAGVVDRIALSPEISTARKMVKLTRTALHQKLPVLNVFFHSVTLLPGATPFVASDTERDEFVGRLASYLEKLRDTTEFRSLTLVEVDDMLRHGTGMDGGVEENANAHERPASPEGIPAGN